MKQVAILNRFLEQFDEESKTDPEILTTERGLACIDVVTKLEMKDQQIQAQVSQNNTTNNLFLTILQKAVGEAESVRSTPKHILEAQAVEVFTEQAKQSTQTEQPIEDIIFE